MSFQRFKKMLPLAAVALLFITSVQPAHSAPTPAGATISNQATVDFTDANGNPLQKLSNIVTTIVSQVDSVLVDPDRSANATPGDVIYYAHRVTNTGNATDTILLGASSSATWTVRVLLDANGDGLYDGGTLDVPIADTGALAISGFIDILVEVTVPTGALDTDTDTTTVTGTSSNNGSVSDSAVDTTTVQAPTLSVVKSVAPGGPQPPGTTLTYTIIISNSGAGQANSVVLTDPVPTNTTYVASTITQDAAARGDGTGDGDNADFNFSTVGAITVNVGSLATSGSTTITFDVTID